MGSSESRKHEQENEMVGNFLSNFSHAFYFNSCLPHYLGGRGEEGIGMGRRMFTNCSFSFSNKIVSQCGAQSCFDEHWPLRHYIIIIFVINFHNGNNAVSTVCII